MFGKDFYPTPVFVIEQMLSGVEIAGKVVLEPSAGNGNIIDYIKQNGAKNVLCCEINRDLAKVCGSKAQLIASDFMEVKSEDISHIDLIVMNPPFSADEKHILHAWEIAPDGCEIIALCNYATYANGYTRDRERLRSVINGSGHITNIGDAFIEADRQTDVTIGLIHLFKPRTNDSEFDGFFDMNEEHEHQENGVMRYSEIRDVVNRYVDAVRRFDEVINAANVVNELISPINVYGHIKFGAFQYVSGDYREINRDTFKKNLQKSAWRTIFNKMNMEKYITKTLMDDINKFIEKQESVPFTMKNIYKMIEMIVGTHGSRMEKVIVEAFDLITKHYHDNRFQMDGWKTNSEYRVNKKFILPRIVTVNFSGKMGSGYYSNETRMDDIHKAMCYVMGVDFNETESFRTFLDNCQGRVSQFREFGELYDWGFFKVRGYKKGSLHVQFKDDKVWDEFNKVACKSKGFQLASKFTSDFRKKSTGVEVYR